MKRGTERGVQKEGQVVKCELMEEGWKVRDGHMSREAGESSKTERNQEPAEVLRRRRWQRQRELQRPWQLSENMSFGKSDVDGIFGFKLYKNIWTISVTTWAITKQNLRECKSIWLQLGQRAFNTRYCRFAYGPRGHRAKPNLHIHHNSQRTDYNEDKHWCNKSKLICRSRNSWCKDWNVEDHWQRKEVKRKVLVMWLWDETDWEEEISKMGQAEAGER